MEIIRISDTFRVRLTSCNCTLQELVYFTDRDGVKSTKWIIHSYYGTLAETMEWYNKNINKDK